MRDAPKEYKTLIESRALKRSNEPSPGAESLIKLMDGNLIITESRFRTTEANPFKAVAGEPEIM